MSFNIRQIRYFVAAAEAGKIVAAASAVGAGRTLELFIYLDRSATELERGITADSLSLGCTPIVNLFEQRADPIRLSHTQSEYRVIPDARRVTLWGEICENILPGSTLHTDQWHAYRSISLRGYRHETCNHEQEEWVSAKGATVNNLEGFWNILKRGINGVYQCVSAKHLKRYLGEFDFRYSHRKIDS